MDIDETITHADPPLGSRWAQMWVHMWAQVLVIFLVYVTKGNTLTILRSERHLSGLTQTVLHILSFPTWKSVSNQRIGQTVFAILTFRCLKSVTTLLSFVSFLLINITRLE